MTREIKFRGKDFLGRWHYGYLHLATGSSSLMIQVDSFDSFGVLPETIGQFTGLLDKNGKEIYEGDILQEFGSGKTVLVVYEAPQFCYADNSFGYKFLNLSGNYTVIGKIHDNPELLEVEE